MSGQMTSLQSHSGIIEKAADREKYTTEINRLRYKCNKNKADSDKRDGDDAKKHMFNCVKLSQRHTITIRLIH